MFRVGGESVKILDYRLVDRDKNFLVPSPTFESQSGRLQILLDEYPNYIYQQTGSFYWSEIDGFMSVYEHQKGTNDGFGGRRFGLQMSDGSIKEFHGSLWDSYKRHPDIPAYRSISATTDLKVWERGFTFYSEKITAVLYQELVENILKSEAK
jgi:hypothetical protein